MSEDIRGIIHFIMIFFCFLMLSFVFTYGMESIYFWMTAFGGMIIYIYLKLVLD